MNLAPILLFTYKRLDTLKNTVNALKNNNLASNSDLFIFSDGSKNDKDYEYVASVRNYIKTIDGFKSINIKFSPQNYGLANSIISGVSKVLEDYDRVIVLEDDILTSNNFLDFMNQALEYYKNSNNIFSVSGYTPVISGLESDGVYFTKRASSWGWATWKTKWDLVDWDVKDYDIFSKSTKLKKEFNKMGSDMSFMLGRQMSGEINSWAIRWCYSQFRLDLYSVFPSVSKVINVGFDSEDATHTKEKSNRFLTKLDNSTKTTFIFNNHVKLDKKIVYQFTRPYSFKNRLLNKLMNFNFLENFSLFFKILKKI